VIDFASISSLSKNDGARPACHETAGHKIAPDGSRRYRCGVCASKFEFEKRFWIISAIYLVGFLLSVFDDTPFILALRHLIAPSITRGSSDAVAFARIVIATGALFVFLSATLRTWGAAYLRTEVVHDTAQHSEALIADGPFRYTRNPLYLANLPMAIGIGVLASRSGFVFLLLVNWIFVYRLILREEESLLKTQGESYRAYCQVVPRFWPALTPRVPAGNLQPDWGQAFAGESFVWLFGVAELLIAVTLDPWIGLVVFLLGFVAHFLITREIQKQRSA
jgi:protein-S-isoprenylcysteine O-methyltransferase Ste14